MKVSIEVENIRCGGCINTITNKLLEIDTINTVDVVLEQQKVIIDVHEREGISHENTKAAAIALLLKLGYPEKGSVEGLEALKGKAKSVVSCAIGKM